MKIVENIPPPVPPTYTLEVTAEELRMLRFFAEVAVARAERRLEAASRFLAKTKYNFVAAWCPEACFKE